MTKVWPEAQLCLAGVSTIILCPPSSALGWFMEKAESEFAACPAFSSQLPI